MTRLVQVQGPAGRRVAAVEEPRLRLLNDYPSVYALASAAVASVTPLKVLVERHLSDDELSYDAIYEGRSEWKLLVPFDHPDEPGRCLVSGTGLTHLGSARDRQAMHGPAEEQLTDSMKMFRWGVEGGKPAEGRAGVSPEWFYKGNGAILRAQGDPLEVPPYAEDGGEEAEIAGLYLIGADGQPWRVGMAAGNEFSDHRFEKRNYLYLAASKIRTCSLGPELVIDPAFHSVAGDAAIERGGKVLWSKAVRTGEDEMCHSVRNIEHHHFKFETHRRPGDVHIHYFGAHSLSFGDGVELRDGDVTQVRFDGFGRPLRNPVRADRSAVAPVAARPLA